MVMTYKSGVPSDTLAKDMWRLLNVIDVITLYTTKRFAIITIGDKSLVRKSTARPK